MQRALSRNSGASSSGAADDDPNNLGQADTALSCLWVLTPLAATVSLLVVVVAMLTNQWLHTEEKMNNPSYNGTGEKDYLSKLTISGLWMLCFTNPGETLYECNRIDYFSKEEYSPDPNDSTMAIPYAVTKSVIFFTVATFLLLGAYLSCIMGHCARHKTLCTFISGVIFIIAGLVMLSGLIVYIATFKAEVGSKLRPRSQLQPPAFEYWYGYSFLLYVAGLISTQFAGTSAIFLFIYKMQYDWRQKQIIDYKRGKLRGLPPAINYVAFDHTMFYPCRRHPQAYINSNSAIHLPVNYLSPVQKRYFFSKEPLQESPCSIHRPPMHSHSNSLKDVATFYDFPPPPTISYQFDDPLVPPFDPDHQVKPFPRDITTNTVSTTADVNCEEFLAESYDDYSPSIQHEHEFVTFDLDHPLPLRTHSNLSINSRNGSGRKSGGFDGDTLRRTTPV